MTKTLDEHYGYLSDSKKVERYRASINQAVLPGHVVVDLGCGTGLLGLMALRAGAQKVFFVEEAAVIEVARQITAQAGFYDSAEFFQKNSFELELPERADVILCDHVGYFGFDYGIPALLADARQRFLKPNGILIPSQIDLQLAPVQSEDCRTRVGQWRDGSVPDEFAWLATTAANTKHALQLTSEDLLAEATTLSTMHMGVDAEAYVSWSTEFICSRGGTLDGVAGWFDCQLFDDIHMTNAPTAADCIDRPQAVLPLDTPVPVSAGDLIQVTLMARPLDNVIAWTIELPASGRRVTHTTFNGLLLDREALFGAHPDRAAQLNGRGKARQIVLSYCDGKRSVAEVQALVKRNYPGLFPTAQALSSFVAQVLSWDTGE